MAKSLKTVIQKTETPARKHNELLGNTPDEKAIIKKVRDQLRFQKDYNGNDDKLFKASLIKRAEKPVNPGSDEQRYSDHNGTVKNIDPEANTLPDASGYGFDGTTKTS